MKGLEPPRLSAPDPKSGTATNYATSAVCDLAYGSTPDFKLAVSIPIAPDFSGAGNATPSKRRGKFIDNSEIRNSLSLLYEKRTFLS